MAKAHCRVAYRGTIRCSSGFVRKLPARIKSPTVIRTKSSLRSAPEGIRFTAPTEQLPPIAPTKTGIGVESLEIHRKAAVMSLAPNQWGKQIFNFFEMSAFKILRKK